MESILANDAETVYKPRSRFFFYDIQFAETWIMVQGLLITGVSVKAKTMQ